MTSAHSIPHLREDGALLLGSGRAGGAVVISTIVGPQRSWGLSYAATTGGRISGRTCRPLWSTVRSSQEMRCACIYLTVDCVIWKHGHRHAYSSRPLHLPTHQIQRKNLQNSVFVRGSGQKQKNENTVPTTERDTAKASDQPSGGGRRCPSRKMPLVRGAHWGLLCFTGTKQRPGKCRLPRASPRGPPPCRMPPSPPPSPKRRPHNLH